MWPRPGTSTPRTHDRAGRARPPRPDAFEVIDGGSRLAASTRAVRPGSRRTAGRRAARDARSTRIASRSIGSASSNAPRLTSSSPRLLAGHRCRRRRCRTCVRIAALCGTTRRRRPSGRRSSRSPPRLFDALAAPVEIAEPLVELERQLAVGRRRRDAEDSVGPVRDEIGARERGVVAGAMRLGDRPFGERRRRRRALLRLAQQRLERDQPSAHRPRIGVRATGERVDTRGSPPPSATR